jgi:hypothetical protein
VLLRMPSLTKRKGSDNWYYRRTIPAEIKRVLAKLPSEKRPRNWYKTHIAISLGTADRTAAKAKCPDVAAAVERQMQALRDGPKPLTTKQITNLSYYLACAVICALVFSWLYLQGDIEGRDPRSYLSVLIFLLPASVAGASAFWWSAGRIKP